ncbi:MAG TPA: hypothetical protein ENG98_04285 [Actinobacteria bacterium]|nr:hypothetical protein [Actinomycetota bacterium]
MTTRPSGLGARAGRTAQRLNPKGLAQGERQRLEAANRLAGIPQEAAPPPKTLPGRAVETLGATPGARAVAPARQGFDALTDVDPAQFRDAFTPQSGGPMFGSGPLAEGQIEDRLAAVAAQSNNRLGREIAERMRRLRGGGN